MTEKRGPVTCECTPVIEARYVEERDRSPSVAIVEAVAAAEGVPPTELDALFDAVDPEALDRLLTSSGEVSGGATVVRFPVGSWNVFVRDDGAIRVCDPDRVTAPAPTFEKPTAD